jgi:hypothetical protein
VRIALYKRSNERHTLEIVRDDGSAERVECETRSCLLHDLLHYAVESEARLHTGFWGMLERGTTLAEMGDREKPLMAAAGQELAAIERIVGALHNVTKGHSTSDMFVAIERFLQASGAPSPEWLNEAFIHAVQARMRRLHGHWKATPFGGAMQLEWAAARPAPGATRP